MFIKYKVSIINLQRVSLYITFVDEFSLQCQGYLEILEFS